MTTVGIKVDHAELKKALTQVQNGLPDELAKGVLRAAQHTTGVIRKAAPLKTGQLRRSYREVFLGRSGLAVGAASLSDLIYAGVIDQGGEIARVSKSGRSYMARYKATNYLLFAEKMAEPGVEKIVDAAVARVIGKGW